MATRPLAGTPRITQAYGVPNSAYRKGYHTGVDYAAPAGTGIFAPANGFARSGDGNASTDGRGWYIIIDGDDGVQHCLYHMLARTGHNYRVTEGQHLGGVGSTGKSTGNHLHWETRRGGVDFNPADWLFAPKTAPATGGQVFNNIQEVTEAYIQMRGVAGTQAEMQGWVGQSKQRWIQASTAETSSTRQQLADVRKALANEQAKPPKEVVKEVIKIVEKPVEVIKEVPVYTHDEQTRNFVAAIYNYFYTRYQTFRDSIKKG